MCHMSFSSVTYSDTVTIRWSVSKTRSEISSKNGVETHIGNIHHLHPCSLKGKSGGFTLYPIARYQGVNGVRAMVWLDSPQKMV